MQSLPPRADVAQLVEQRFRKPQVTGSNPVVGSPLKRRLQMVLAIIAARSTLRI
jgi:hypothetical protein